MSIILRSVNTTSNSSFSSRLIACRPDVAVVTSWPARWKIFSQLRQMTGSSSTTRILAAMAQASASRVCTGNWMVNVDPAPGVLSTLMSPPCCSTIP